MSTPDDDDGGALRRRAAPAARVEIDRTLKQLERMSPDAVQELVYELSLHRIELTMQNEELRRTQVELDEARSRYFNLYELAPVAYFTVSEHGLIQQANLCAADLLGVARGMLVRLPLAQFVLQEDQPIFYRHRKLLFETGQPQSFELRMLRSGEDRFFWADIEACVAAGEGGAPAWRIVMSDATERRQAVQLREAKEAAEVADQAKSRFLSAASHDLRQPTHAMGLLVAQLAELTEIARLAPLAARLDACVTVLQDMLNALFDWSRVESEPVRVQEFAIQDVFDRVRDSLSFAAAEKGLRLRIRPCDAWVRSDPTLLHRILLNLAGNALRYTPKGSILMACRPMAYGTHVRLEVWDSGIGIAPTYHQDIFNEFFQVANQERDRANGLGLGLSIVKRAARQLGLALSLRSDLGCGTRFSLLVPVVEGRGRLTAREMAIPLPVPTNHFPDLRVMVIEDDAFAREALAELLRSWGCTVATADGFSAAREALVVARLPRLILSDYRLPGQHNGIAAVCALRQIASYNIPACLVTGDLSGKVEQEAKAAGIALLHKPVRPARLYALIKSVIDGAD
jgi:PAS domain S-box-containing protein